MSREGTETKAIAAVAEKKPMEDWSYRQRTFQEDDVEVELTHCGVCHTDLHFVDGDMPGTEFPLVPGHEGVGIVRKVGSAVSNGLKVGDVVGIGPHSDSCQHCDFCDMNEDVLCAKSVPTYAGKDRLGNTTYGCFSHNITVSSHKASLIPEGMDPAEAAPLLCAGVTVYTPIVQHRKPHYKTCAVLGVGGLGHLAIQYAAAMGLEVTAVSRTDAKKEEALGFGATNFLATNDPDAVAAARDKFDLILNTIPVNIDMNLYLSMLRPLGSFLFLGLATKLELSPLTLLIKKATVAGGFIGGVQDMKDMLEFSARHNIRPVIEKLPFTPEGANEALRKLVDGSVRYRSVLCKDLA